MDINPKQFANRNTRDQSPFVSNRNEFGKDDDDPLSIKDASLNVIGIFLAVMTFFLPAICVFLERPYLHKNVGTYNQTVNKDGY